ncbi:FCD domain-containing protein [Rhodobacter sp. NTK016B]|uniref:GntR family transcriptional regulator n=2 Tax=Bacteria TaxID=2 RepID=UPI001A8FF69E|nr:FCD domain-containing protein [Rhodobacter sp. NTK016B]MBN8293376.1 FCD domain-containing protein [Rhodobacter sp. NTK016B]
MSTTENAQASAYDLLRHEILHGDLLPGERLRAADLRERYNLGLTPIREALMRLSSEGMVTNEVNRGARVREATLDELRDLMQTRREIEELCLTKAIKLGDAEWEGEIVRAMHLLARAPLPESPDDRETAAAWERLHRKFHYALVAAAGSTWLLQIWRELADHSERYRKLRLLNYRNLAADVRDVNAEHRQIMDAVLNRDATHAVALMNTHLRKTEDAVARLLTPTDS